jgi:hypothetical protein
MAIYSNLSVDQGSTFTVYIDVTDSDGDSFNLTGYTVAGQIRKNYNSLNAISFNATLHNSVGGTIGLNLTDAQTNLMKSGRYVYDVEVTSPGGEITRVVEGQVEVFAGVTR